MKLRLHYADHVGHAVCRWAVEGRTVNSTAEEICGTVRARAVVECTSGEVMRCRWVGVHTSALTLGQLSAQGRRRFVVSGSAFCTLQSSCICGWSVLCHVMIVYFVYLASCRVTCNAICTVGRSRDYYQTLAVVSRRKRTPETS